MDVTGIIDTVRQFRGASGVDEQIDLRALQCIGITQGEARILRVWFNDGRIRDWDASSFLSQGKGRVVRLRDPAQFVQSATVWDGAPGFDLGTCHSSADSIDFDPYEIWVSSKDVTRHVLRDEHELGLSNRFPLPSDFGEAAESTISDGYSPGVKDPSSGGD